MVKPFAKVVGLLRSLFYTVWTGTVNKTWGFVNFRILEKFVAKKIVLQGKLIPDILKPNDIMEKYELYKFMNKTKTRRRDVKF